MANTPENMLKDILGNPEAMGKIMSMMQAFSGDSKETDTENAASPLPFGLDNPEMLARLGTAFRKMANDNDPRINLLMAIKPYLNKERSRGAEQAMQILKLSKMSSLFEELKIL